jgi:hypothetical protein
MKVLEAWEAKHELSEALKASKKAVEEELAKQEAIKAQIDEQKD